MRGVIEKREPSKCDHALKKVLADYSIQCMYCGKIVKNAPSEKVEMKEKAKKNHHPIESFQF